MGASWRQIPPPRRRGYTRDELLALSIHDLRPPVARGLTEDRTAEADIGSVLFETVHTRKEHVSSFIQKPYTSAGIAEKLKACLR